MDSDDDDRFLDEVTRIKKAGRLKKARQAAQDMVREKREEQDTDKFVNKHYREEVERLNNLVKAREDALKEAKYTIRKLEERLKGKGDEEKSTLLKEKKAGTENDTAKGELEAKVATMRKQAAERDDRIDQILQIVTTLERNVSESKVGGSLKSATQTTPFRTVEGLLLQVRHGLLNMKSPSSSGKSVGGQATSKAASKGSERTTNKQQQARVLELESSSDKDIADSLFDMCRHLEEENARLLRKLGMEGDPESAELPPKVKKLISFYRSAIIRTREQLEATVADLERERDISRGLRQQVRQGGGGSGDGLGHFLPRRDSAVRGISSSHATKSSNPYVDEGRIPHWKIEMSSASVAAEINELDSEIKHLQERLELAAVKKTQQAVAEALGEKKK